jgi:two-component sensor histidine kinase
MKASEVALIGSAFHILQHELFINSQAHGFHGREDKEYFVRKDTVDSDGITKYEKVDLTPEFKAVRIALAHSELSEALEGIRKNKQDEHIPEFTSEEIEYADTVIRILEYAEHRGLRLFEAIIAKHDFNCNREHMHGGKKF